MYLAVVYQDWVVVSVYVLVGAIFKERLILCDLKVLHPGLLVIKGVQLMFRKVVHDAGSVRIPDNVDWGAKTISAPQEHTNRRAKIFLLSLSLPRIRQGGWAYSSQSTATRRLMSWVGSPTAVRIRTMVTSPALGILAAPTLANVAVILQGRQGSTVTQSRVKSNIPARLQEVILTNNSQDLIGGLSSPLSSCSRRLTWQSQSGPSQVQFHSSERWRWLPRPRKVLFRPCLWWHPPGGQNVSPSCRCPGSPPSIGTWQAKYRRWQNKSNKRPNGKFELFILARSKKSTLKITL